MLVFIMVDLIVKIRHYDLLLNKVGGTYLGFLLLRNYLYVNFYGVTVTGISITTSLP